MSIILPLNTLKLKISVSICIKNEEDGKLEISPELMAQEMTLGIRI